MPEFVALDTFLQEHRHCGKPDGGVDGERVWMACDCGVGIAHPFKPAEPLDQTDERRWADHYRVRAAGPGIPRTGA